jgi:O-antigen/teichoic acid export membrane protein
MILIIAVGLLFSSFDTIEFWFQSQVLEGILALLRSSQLIVSSLAKVLFIAFHLPLIAFVWLLLADQVVKTLGMIWVYLRKHQSILDWKVNWSKGLEMLKDSWPLIPSLVMVTIYMKIDQVMLGNMANSEAVGNYAAAVRFSEIWYFIPLAVCSSVFPAILRAKQRSKEEYYARLQQLYDFMAWIALAIAIPMTFISVPLMATLIGHEFSEAGKILSLHIWSAVFVFLGHAQHQWLMAENLSKLSFAKTSLGAISNILLNLLLIPLYQGVGAAIATMISYSICSHFSCLFYRPLWANGWMLTKALFIPFNFRKNLFYLSQVKKLGWNSQRSN